MRSALTRAASALLALLLLSALLGGCAGGGSKPPAQVTPVPKTSPAPSPTPDAPAPDKPDKPEGPDPTPEPAPETHRLALADVVGVWELYSTEVEGDYNLAADTGTREWLVVRDCARADFVELRSAFGMEEHLNCPITDEPGGLFLNIPDDGYGRECLFLRADGDELELSFSFRNADGTPGGSNHVLRRLQEPDARAEGAAVSPRELRALNDRVNTVEENGFFQCSFARPQEIDWHEALYNGAGVDCEPSELALAEFERYADEDWDCPILCLTENALREFVWNKTLTSYAEAQAQLWTSWYESEDGYLLTSHGDTNFVPITLDRATVDGEIYRLYYERADYANSVWEPVPFVMTLRIHDGAWQYISNLRADVPRATLLTVDYFYEDEELPESMRVTGYVETEARPSDEPSWIWAVLTAREDGVRYSVDRADLDYDEADYFLVMFLDRFIGDNITSGVLQKGESVAVKVNTPWYPTIRVMATKDTLYGNFWFGEQNMLHVFDLGARQYVDGRDADAEGRGCSPNSEDELMAFLRSGDWFWLDPVTYEPRAVLRFPYGHGSQIESSELYYDLNVWYSYENDAGDGAPERIGFYRGYGDDADWSALPERFLRQDDFLGDYHWTAYQLDGEQILYLSYTEGSRGPLNYLLPGVEEDATDLMFVRFTGTTLEEGQG